MFSSQAPQEHAAFLGIVSVLHFEPQEAGVDHFPVRPLPDHPAAGRGHRMCEDGNSARRPDELDGERRVRCVVLHEVARVRSQDRGERLGAARHGTGRHEGVRNVGPAHGRTRSHMVDDIVPAQGVVLRQERDHPLGAGEPRVFRLGDFLEQAGVCGIVEVAERDGR